MSGFQRDFSVEQFDAAGQAVFFRVFVPLIEDIEFFIGGETQIFHPAHDLRHAGAARAVKAAGFHFDAGEFARFEEEFPVGDFCRGVGREDGDTCHG